METFDWLKTEHFSSIYMYMSDKRGHYYILFEIAQMSHAFCVVHHVHYVHHKEFAHLKPKPLISHSSKK